MRIENLMTRRVVTVLPDAPLKDVARLLVTRGISGVPVCDAAGEVLGVVSETDIVTKAEGVAVRSGGMLDWLYGECEECVARTAGEAMTSPAVTIEPAATVAEAARLMAAEKVNRLPVVADGDLVGIVTRADLVGAYARPDVELCREIYHDVLLRTLWIEPDRIAVICDGGRVTLTGEVATHSEAELVAVHVGRVPGVVAVDVTGLVWRDDDLETRRALAHTAEPD